MKRISFLGFDKSFINNDIFKTGPDGRPHRWSIYHSFFEQNGYDLFTDDLLSPDESDFMVCLRLPDFKVIKSLLKSRKMHLSLYHVFEPPVVVPLHSRANMRWLCRLFGAVVTWDDYWPGKKNFHKGYYPMYKLNAAPPQIPYNERKLITNISGNKTGIGRYELYTSRVAAIRFMEQNHPEDFDLYGTGWSNDEYPSYKGEIEHKYHTLKNYKFSFCFENMRHYTGYVTEKIFDCFDAKCVPVYWGADNRTDYIPKECFIDFRDFSGYSELYQYISTMPEEIYNGYIDAINQYADSELYRPFLPESFDSNVFSCIKKAEADSGYSYFLAYYSYFRLYLYQVIAPRLQGHVKRLADMFSVFSLSIKKS